MGFALASRGVTPNALSLTGAVLTVGVAICLVWGAGDAAPWEKSEAPTAASWWPVTVAVVFTLACACDFLDGPVARQGGMQTRFGGVLDSTLDRFGDLLIYWSCAVHFALAGNVTYVALSAAAAGNGVLISYVKARAERDVEDCSIGYWKRGERCGLFLVAAYAGHIPAALWLLGTIPLLTVLRRLRYARLVLGTNGELPSSQLGGDLRPWTQPRGTLGYNLCMGLACVYVLFAPRWSSFFFGAADPLGALFAAAHA